MTTYEFGFFTLSHEDADVAKAAAEWLEDRLDYIDHLPDSFDVVEAHAKARQECREKFGVTIK